MADAPDSKSVARKGVWVQVPPPALQIRGEKGQQRSKRRRFSHSLE